MAKARIWVRAKAAGYYANQYREIGDKFTIKRKEELGKWMIVLDKDGNDPATKDQTDPKPSTEKGTGGTGNLDLDLDDDGGDDEGDGEGPQANPPI